MRLSDLEGMAGDYIQRTGQRADLFPLVFCIAVAALFVLLILALPGCVGVQRPDGGTGVAVGVKSEVAAAAVQSLPGGDLLASLLGLGGTTAGTSAYAAYLLGSRKGWDEHAKETGAGKGTS